MADDETNVDPGAWSRRVQRNDTIPIKARQLDELLATIFSLHSAFYQMLNSVQIEEKGAKGARESVDKSLDDLTGLLEEFKREAIELEKSDGK